MFRDRLNQLRAVAVTAPKMRAAAGRRRAARRTPPLALVTDGSGPFGALILGGDHGSLGVARSLGRHGIPVWYVSDDKFIAAHSRYTRRSFSWSGPNDPGAVDFLLDLAMRYRLNGWVLFPASDREVRLIGENTQALSAVYRLITPPWDVARIAVDKRLMDRHAASLGLDHPKSYEPRTRQEVVELDCRFPLILKPSTKDSINALTRAKAWPIDNRVELLEKYDSAVALVGADGILLQELIPGGGEAQFSYTGVWSNGKAVASMIARRTRQYPIDVGTGTFVESVENAAVEEAANVFLASLNYSGMVEIEFKHDVRDGGYNILDVNPRVWTWGSLGALAGVDFPFIQWRLAMGEPVAPMRGRAGVSWMYVPKDMLAAAAEIVDGRLTWRRYLQSFAKPLTLAAFATDDPAPGLVDLPIAATRFIRQRLAGS